MVIGQRVIGTAICYLASKLYYILYYNILLDCKMDTHISHDILLFVTCNTETRAG